MSTNLIKILKYDKNKEVPRSRQRKQLGLSWFFDLLTISKQAHIKS